MALKIIKCPWCGKEARITYEENRVYQMKCYSCHNTMLHVDHSFDSAVEFFEHIVVLPCKVGSIIWFADRNIKMMQRYEVLSFSVCQGETFIVACCLPGSSRLFSVDDVGRTVFLSRKEAEAALAGKGAAHEADTV